MELDLNGIYQLAREQEIDTETVDEALSEALRLAYLKTPHAAKHARVELDPRAGTFTIWAQDEIPQEPTEDDPHPAPKLGEEYDDTPNDFGRLAAATARQVIQQLFRKAEDDKIFGAFSRPARQADHWRGAAGREGHRERARGRGRRGGDPAAARTGAWGALPPW